MWGVELKSSSLNNIFQQMQTWYHPHSSLHSKMSRVGSLYSKPNSWPMAIETLKRTILSKIPLQSSIAILIFLLRSPPLWVSTYRQRKSSKHTCTLPVGYCERFTLRRSNSLKSVLVICYGYTVRFIDRLIAVITGTQHSRSIFTVNSRWTTWWRTYLSSCGIHATSYPDYSQAMLTISWRAGTKSSMISRGGQANRSKSKSEKQAR